MSGTHLREQHDAPRQEQRLGPRSTVYCASVYADSLPQTAEAAALPHRGKRRSPMSSVVRGGVVSMTNVASGGLSGSAEVKKAFRGRQQRGEPPRLSHCFAPTLRTINHRVRSAIALSGALRGASEALHRPLTAVLAKVRRRVNSECSGRLAHCTGEMSRCWNEQRRSTRVAVSYCA